jgi:hypothetical protein
VTTCSCDACQLEISSHNRPGTKNRANATTPFAAMSGVEEVACQVARDRHSQRDQRELGGERDRGTHPVLHLQQHRAERIGAGAEMREQDAAAASDSTGATDSARYNTPTMKYAGRSSSSRPASARESTGA